ncbi:SDR family oxidoreductase [Streptomyces sp. L7]
MDAVIDVSNVTTTSAKKAVAFFDTVGHHLLDAGARAGVRHHVVLSIVGIDRVGLGYYRGKLRQEDVVKDGPLPWTVLRATQFHEFAAQTLDRVPGPLAVVPRMRTQPVAAREVARHLGGTHPRSSPGHGPDLAGPRVEQLVDMVRRLLRARHELAEQPLPVQDAGRDPERRDDRGRATAGRGRAVQGPRGSQTFDEWLGSYSRSGRILVQGG